MHEVPYFNVLDFFNSIIQAHQRVTRNYLKNVSGYHHDIRDIAHTYSKLCTKIIINPAELVKVYNFNLDFLLAQQLIWKQIFINSTDDEPECVVFPKKGDKRFLDSEWDNNPYFNFIKQNYLLASKLSEQIINGIEFDDKNRKKLNFYISQYVNALSPSNFLFTNPEAIRLALQTNGKSVLDGVHNLLHDLEKGRITQVDKDAFKVGVSLATTPGFVIYENELMQVIQYSPTTKKVYDIPLLIIPPWINKYYILDLQQKNSFVKFLIEKGITVFMISWRNPKQGSGQVSFDDYVEKGAIKAIEVVQNCLPLKKINTLGYCLGGTLLGIASAIITSRSKQHSINSATFLASMIDFSNIGPMGDVIDCALIRKLERGELLHHGILNGSDMETAFNLIRPNDLIWYYVVNNYLKGLKPTAFDVIFWTNDNTNLPAEMYKYYMKHIILENKLSRKNALRICNTPIDIGKIDFSVIVIGLKEDTISPAVTCFTTTQLVNGSVEFILGESGHVLGVVNPPSKNKYGYYVNGKLGLGFEEWKNTAQYFSGSWWNAWTDRLIKQSGEEIMASVKIGNEIYKPIEPAPGRYVIEKC